MAEETRKKILIIEDNSIMIKAMELKLGKEGYDARGFLFDSPEKMHELEKLLQDEGIDMIICDGLKGNWSHVRKTAEIYQLPFILNTGNSILVQYAEAEGIPVFDKGKYGSADKMAEYLKGYFESRDAEEKTDNKS